MKLHNILFLLLFIFGIGFFLFNMMKIRKAILIGKPREKVEHKLQRLGHVLRIALGQSKMVSRPISGLLHILVYIGFVIINIEVFEIVIDGIFDTHRFFFNIIGETFYNGLIASFEILALLVIVSVMVFWIRRNVIRINRFQTNEMKGWPKKDANKILYIEFVLMIIFLTMNVSDYTLQLRAHPYYIQAGLFPVSGLVLSIFKSMPTESLIFLERFCWWVHIIGILFFLNYLYYSKHLHIILAFPNTFYTSLSPKGDFGSMPHVTKEVKLMLGILEETTSSESSPEKFGASDVADLNRTQLLNAYSCTECGRCTDECPANKSGKLLSPRNIMMKVRDRLEDITKGQSKDKQLLKDYISEEELWACTTCNACVEACPININPLSIIMAMRQYLVMEQSSVPTGLNKMMTNIENNGAPWPYNNEDRLNWNS